MHEHRRVLIQEPSPDDAVRGTSKVRTPLKGRACGYELPEKEAGNSVREPTPQLHSGIVPRLADFFSLFA